MKNFVHPHGAYRLQYPAHWENLQKDDGRSCGFGPRDRDDVGLWISIMPISLDTERMGDDLIKLFEQSLEKAEAGNMRRDPSLQQYGLKADMLAADQGGHYWLLAGGDIVLFASTQVPPGERDTWNPLFDQVMASLKITRDEELVLRRAANEVLRELKQRFPEEKFEFDDNGIRGGQRSINLSNLYQEIRAVPKRWQEIVKDFIEGVAQSVEAPLGTELWDDVHGMVVPVLKPLDYIEGSSATRSILTVEWLADVVICYVIKNKKYFRFLTAWDVNRWGISEEILHQKAMENLANLPWPERLEGSRQHDGGRVILVHTEDDLASSRILHPDFHKLFSGPLGSPFWAGIPNRSTLVVYSDRRELKKRIGRQLKKDHRSSAHAITPRPFLVTHDGIAQGADA